MCNRLWVLGASDPEMAAIERLLRAAGESVAHAVGRDGKRVNASDAYQAAGIQHVGESGWHASRDLPIHWYGDEDSAIQYCWIECQCVGAGDAADTEAAITGLRHVVVDHHRPGDPGYGRPPEEYLAASSIGQVLAILPESAYPQGTDAVREIAMMAAADHCLEAAYRGRCPGVDPNALMAWRIRERAAFQRRSEAEVMADVEAARRILREARRYRQEGWAGIGCAQCGTDDHDDCYDDGYSIREYADLRGRSIPELPEAAAREGIPFLADQVGRDERRKVVLMAAPPELVAKFLAGEIVTGLTGYYGDPARGFAGGYIA